MEDFIISGKKYKSRLILGTGKYKSFEETAKAVNAAEVEIVTVAVRRVNVTNPKEPMLVDFLDPKKLLIYQILRAVIQRTRRYVP